jgi:hypothetical protein
MNPSVISKKQRIFFVVSLSLLLSGMAAWRALTPNPDNEQAVLDVETHPVASAVGAAIPSLLLAPFAYWFSGWCIAFANRRYLRKGALNELEPSFGVNSASDGNRDIPTEAKHSEPSVETKLPPKTDFDEEESWAAVMKEYDSGNRRDGLYAKLYANCEGDESKTKAAYLKARVAEMMQDAQKQRSLEDAARTLEANVDEARAVQKAAEARANYRATYVGGLHGGPPR